MNDKFSDYLTSLGLKGPFLERTEEIYAKLKVLSRGKANEIFVSESIDADGRRQYDDLVLFVKDYFFEASSYLTLEEFSCVSLKSAWWTQLKVENYNLEKASDESRMRVEIQVRGVQSSWSLRASQGNCDTLRDLALEYILQKTE